MQELLNDTVNEALYLYFLTIGFTYIYKLDVFYVKENRVKQLNCS